MNAQETQPNEGINDNPGEMELNADENAAGTTHLNEAVTIESEIEKLTADYKRDLNERNIQPLSDDYIKFIRFGQHFIDKNGSGVLAYILHIPLKVSHPFRLKVSH